MRYLIYLGLFFCATSSVLLAEEKGRALINQLLKYDTVIIVEEVDSETEMVTKSQILKKGKLLNDTLKYSGMLPAGRRQFIVGYSGLNTRVLTVNDRHVKVAEGDRKLALDEFIKLWEKVSEVPLPLQEGEEFHFGSSFSLENNSLKEVIKQLEKE